MTENQNLVEEKVEIAPGFFALTGKMVEAPAPEPQPEPVAETPAPVVETPTPAPAPVVEAPAPELEFAKKLFEDPTLALDFATTLKTDYDTMPAKDLYKLKWLEDNKNIPGITPEAFDKVFEKKYYNFDPSAPQFGLEFDEYIELMREAESAKTQFNTRKAEIAQTVQKLKESEPVAQAPAELTPQEKAELANAFRRDLSAANLSYDFVPAELAQVLDPNAPTQFLARFEQENVNKPFLGLERYLDEKGERFNIAAIAEAEFKLQSMKDIVTKALEHGKSLGRAEAMKDVTGRLNAPIPNGNAGSGGAKTITTPSGITIQLPQ
jgi:hypothetical protein